MKASLKFATEIARRVGMVPTWPNVQTIRLAIESEAELSGVSIMIAAIVIERAAKERSSAGNGLTCASSWEHFQVFRENNIDRFWFEDARWRTKFAYAEFSEHLRAKKNTAMPEDGAVA